MGGTWRVSKKHKTGENTGGIAKAFGLDDGSCRGRLARDLKAGCLRIGVAKMAATRNRRQAPLDAATPAVSALRLDTPETKMLLEKLYAKYNHRVFVPPDPLQFVYRYTDRRDLEIVAFLAAALAYGRVRQIERSLTQLLDRMNGAPFEFTSHFDDRARVKLHSFKHRFTTGDDLSDLLVLFRRVFDDHSSVESFFALGYRSEDATILPALSQFCDSLCHMHAGPVSTDLNYLLANPSRGSASKRLNLFLRWMVRGDEVDLGLWQSLDKAKLIVPMDVHMGRLCRILGLHDDKTISLSTALKVTAAFARMNPDDPVKYDFALSRIGILEDCHGRWRPACESCELHRLCARRPSQLESV